MLGKEFKNVLLEWEINVWAARSYRAVSLKKKRNGGSPLMRRWRVILRTNSDSIRSNLNQPQTPCITGSAASSPFPFSFVSKTEKAEKM